MTRTIWPHAAACAAAALLAAACGGTPVGSRHHQWHQSNDAVEAYIDTHDPEVLIRDQTEYDNWVDGLPPQMRSDAEDVTLDEQIAVAGYYGKCMQESSIQDLGGGQITFEVIIPPEEENTDCAATPLVVELWIVELDDLSVDSAADIDLVVGEDG